jgi:hypothetical protein
LWLLDPLPGNLAVQVLGTFMIIFNYVFAFYSLALFIIPNLYYKKILTGLGLFLLLGSIFTLVDVLNFNYLMPALGVKEFVAPIDETLMNEVRPFIFVSIPAVGYFFNDLSLEKIETQNIRERSLLLKELNFLKNQFNSHITFNFLNYCYSKVHQLSDDTAEAIDLFSNMLRYTLTIRPDTKVPVQREVEYIEDFIQLQKLLSSEVYVNFNSRGEFNSVHILPSMVITFIENAFTHGEFNRPTNPINIDLQLNDSTLVLTVANKKRSRRNLNTTGVGLENVKQLLQLYYPERYNLRIENNADDYSTHLELSLT